MKTLKMNLKRIFCVLAILFSGLLVSCSCGGDPYKGMSISNIAVEAYAEGQNNVDSANASVTMSTSSDSTANYFYIVATVTGYNGDREDIVSITAGRGYEGYVSFVRYDFENRNGDRVVKALFKAVEGIESMTFEVLSKEGMLYREYKIHIVNPILDFNFVKDTVPVMKGESNIILEQAKESKYIIFSPAGTTQKDVTLYFDNTRNNSGILDILDGAEVANSVVEKQNFVVSSNALELCYNYNNSSIVVASIDNGVLTVNNAEITYNGVKYSCVPTKFGLSAKIQKLNGDWIEKSVAIEVLDPIDTDNIYLGNRGEYNDTYKDYEYIGLNREQTSGNELRYSISLPNNTVGNYNDYKEANILFANNKSTGTQKPSDKTVLKLNGTTYYVSNIIGQGSKFAIDYKNDNFDGQGIRCEYNSNTGTYLIRQLSNVSRSFDIEFRLYYDGYYEFFDGVKIIITVNVISYPDGINLYDAANNMTELADNDSIIIYNNYTSNIKGAQMRAEITVNNSVILGRAYKVEAIYCEDIDSHIKGDAHTCKGLSNAITFAKLNGSDVEPGKTELIGGVDILTINRTLLGDAAKQVEVDEALASGNIYVRFYCEEESNRYQYSEYVNVIYVKSDVNWTSSAAKVQKPYNEDNKFNANNAANLQQYLQIDLNGIANWYGEDASNYNGFINIANKKVDVQSFEITQKTAGVLYVGNEEDIKNQAYIYIADEGEAINGKVVCKPILNVLLGGSLGEAEVKIVLQNGATIRLTIQIFYNLPDDAYLTLGRDYLEDGYKSKIEYIDNATIITSNNQKVDSLIGVVGDTQSFVVNLGKNGSFEINNLPSGMRASLISNNPALETLKNADGNSNGRFRIISSTSNTINLKVVLQGLRDEKGVVVSKTIEYNVPIKVADPIVSTELKYNTNQIYSYNTLNTIGAFEQTDFANRGIATYEIVANTRVNNNISLADLQSTIQWNIKYGTTELGYLKYSESGVEYKQLNKWQDGGFQSVGYSNPNDPEKLLYPTLSASKDKLSYYSSADQYYKVQISNSGYLYIYLPNKDLSKMQIWVQTAEEDQSADSIKTRNSNISSINNKIEVSYKLEYSYTNLSNYTIQSDFEKKSELKFGDLLRIEDIVLVANKDTVSFDLRDLEEGVDYTKSDNYLIMNDTAKTNITIEYIIKPDTIGDNEDINREIVAMYSNDRLMVSIDTKSQTISIRLLKINAVGMNGYINPVFSVELNAKGSQNSSGVYLVKSVLTVKVEDGKGVAFSVRNQQDLQNISNNLASNYVLTNNISLSSTFRPIGSIDNPFTGSIDGDKYSISGFNYNATIPNKIDSEKTYYAAVGLFAAASGATFSNISIQGINLDIDVNDSMEQGTNIKSLSVLYVGVLVGKAESCDFTNCIVDDGNNLTKVDGAMVQDLAGNMSANDTRMSSQGIKVDNGYSSSYVGGMVGYLTEKSTLTNPKTRVVISCNVSGDNSAIGGLVGSVNITNTAHSISINNASGVLSGDSIFATADVITVINPETLITKDGSYAYKGTNIGGVVGLAEINNGKVFIDGTTARSIIFGTDTIGGIAGKIGGNVTISSATSMPTIVGLTNIGGVAGVSSSEIDNCKVKFLNYEDDYAYFNTGIIGANNIGGIVGANTFATLNEYNSVYTYVTKAVADDIAFGLDVKRVGAEESKYYGDIVIYSVSADNQPDTNPNVGEIVGVCINVASGSKEFDKTFAYCNINLLANDKEKLSNVLVSVYNDDDSVYAIYRNVYKGGSKAIPKAQYIQ